MTEKIDTSKDWWGFVSACKNAVHNSLQNAKFNHANRAADVAVKAVLRMIDASGARLDKMYESASTPQYARPRFAMPQMTVCTVTGWISIYDRDFVKIDDFPIELSWMKDPREVALTTTQRHDYIEALLNARSVLMAEERNKTMSYPSGYQIGVRDNWQELAINSRRVD